MPNDSMYQARHIALVLVMMHVLGFGGSALVVMSVTMRSVVWLRSFGLAGSLLFIAYGVTLGAWPVVATNVVTTSIHAYQLSILAGASARATVRTPARARDEIRVSRSRRLASTSSSPLRWAQIRLRGTL